jgi:predicted dehydrogenase
VRSGGYDEPVRIGLLGGGIMGTHHARVSGQVRGGEITHVVDADLDRATIVAGTIGAKAAGTWHEVVEGIDAAIIAVPSEFHCPLALALIDAGKHVLVEKPIATTIDDAEAMVAAADAAGTVLMVGHVERFNPAVLELENVVFDPIHLSTARISPFSTRVTVGVVLDLMIHDLDIVLALADSPVSSVAAVARQVLSDSEDLASVVLEFDNGVTADLVASRIGQQKIRTLAITERERYVSVDLLRQDVTINRVDHSEYVSSEGSRYRQTGMVEIPFLENRGEPLMLEQTEFVRAIRTGTAPRVTGRDGTEALRLADRILEAIHSQNR